MSYDTMTLMSLAGALAQDRVNEEISRAKEAGLELSDVERQSMYTRYFNEEMSQFETELAEFNTQLNKGGNAMVHIYNAAHIIRLEDGTEIPEPVEHMVLSDSEFNQAISNGSIASQPGRTARVYGATRNITEEFSMENFEDSDEIVIEWLPGIIEKITIDQFVDALTNQGDHHAKRKVYDQAEIKYGRCEGGYDDTENLTIINEDEMVDSSSWRTREERSYYKDQIRNIIEKEYKTCGELYKALVGKLFSLPRVGRVFSPNGIVTNIHHWNGKLYYSDWSVYTIPYNSIDKEDRAMLLDMYHAKKEEINNNLQERKERMDTIGINALNKVMKLSDSNNLIEEIKSIVTSSDIAWAVMVAAKQYRLVRNEPALNRFRWNVIQSIAKGGELPKVEEVKQPEAMGKLNDINNITKEEAQAILAYARGVFSRSGQRPLQYNVWKQLNAKACSVNSQSNKENMN